MSRRDEEDIEVCSRSIDLWGSLFIDCYIVACQAFFLLFLYFMKIQYVKCENTLFLAFGRGGLIENQVGQFFGLHNLRDAVLSNYGLSN